jgi:acyl carrier protein
MSVVARLAKLFQETFDHDASTFSSATTPEDVAKWDSIGHMSLVGAMEQEFGQEFEIDEIMEMENVAKILAILAARGVTD